MIDTPAEVPLEGVAEEIPIGVLNDIGMKFAEDIDEAPRDGLLISLPGLDVEIRIVHAFFRMVDVNRLRCDIEIAYPDCRLTGIQGVFKIGA